MCLTVFAPSPLAPPAAEHFLDEQSSRDPGRIRPPMPRAPPLFWLLPEVACGKKKQKQTSFGSPPRRPRQQQLDAAVALHFYFCSPHLKNVYVSFRLAEREGRRVPQGTVHPGGVHGRVPQRALKALPRFDGLLQRWSQILHL